MAAGLLSGALTQSPAIGTASEAINSLPLPQDQRTLLAIADSKRFRGFATPTTRQPKACPR